jgi:hypothetical protein
MSSDIRKLAEDFHLTYERVAAGSGWETQEDCRVSFDDLPAANQITMLSVCAEIYARHIDPKAAEIERLKEQLKWAEYDWNADPEKVVKPAGEKRDE